MPELEQSTSLEGRVEELLDDKDLLADSDRLYDQLKVDLPWLHDLPGHDLPIALLDIATELWTDAISQDHTQAVQTIREWRHTAEVWSANDQDGTVSSDFE